MYDTTIEENDPSSMSPWTAAMKSPDWEVWIRSHRCEVAITGTYCSPRARWAQRSGSRSGGHRTVGCIHGTFPFDFFWYEIVCFTTGFISYASNCCIWTLPCCSWCRSSRAVLRRSGAPQGMMQLDSVPSELCTSRLSAAVWCVHDGWYTQFGLRHHTNGRLAPISWWVRLHCYLE